MRKFTDTLRASKAMNESVTKINSREEFLSFGKHVMQSMMGPMYNEDAVHGYLSEMHDNAHGDYTKLLETFNESTMGAEERRNHVIQRFNSIVNQLTENSGDHVLQNRLINLIREYPVFLNEVALTNTEVLLERCDVTGKFKMNESTRKASKTAALSFYEPQSITEMTSMLKVMNNVLKESVVQTVPGSYKTTILPDGYGGFDVDFVEIANNQKTRAAELETEINQIVAVVNSVTEEEQAERSEAFKLFKAFVDDENNRYEFSANKIQNNIRDIDFFVMLCLRELLKPVNDNIEHLQKNFINVKFTHLNNLYNEYLYRTGLENSTWSLEDKQDDIVRKNLSYAKLYEINDMVLGLSKYQRLDTRQIALKMVTIIKPMIDSIRLDLQILKDRTQLQY